MSARWWESFVDWVIHDDCVLEVADSAAHVGLSRRQPRQRWEFVEQADVRELLVVDACRIFILKSRWNISTQRWRLYGDVLPQGGLA